MALFSPFKFREKEQFINIYNMFASWIVLIVWKEKLLKVKRRIVNNDQLKLVNYLETSLITIKKVLVEEFYFCLVFKTN